MIIKAVAIVLIHIASTFRQITASKDYKSLESEMITLFRLGCVGFRKLLHDVKSSE